MMTIDKGTVLKTHHHEYSSKPRKLFILHDHLVTEHAAAEIDCPFIGDKERTDGEKKIVCKYCGVTYECTWNHSSSREGDEYEYTHQPVKVPVDLLTVKLAIPRARSPK